MDKVDPLDRFGEFIVANLRDKAINFYIGLEKGHWKAPSLKPLQEKMKGFSEEQLAVIRECVVQTIDDSIHDFLFALQENHDTLNDIQILVNGENVAELSDGLHGEPYTEDGWYARFSKYKGSQNED
jgi:hypothetical protein